MAVLRFINQHSALLAALFVVIALNRFLDWEILLPTLVLATLLSLAWWSARPQSKGDEAPSGPSLVILQSRY